MKKQKPDGKEVVTKKVTFKEDSPRQKERSFLKKLYSSIEIREEMPSKDPKADAAAQNDSELDKYPWRLCKKCFPPNTTRNGPPRGFITDIPYPFKG